MAALIFSATGHGESVTSARHSPSVGSAHVDFRIVVPAVLRLETGSGILLANLGSRETVLITSEQGGVRRTVAGRVQPASGYRANAGVLAPSALHTPLSYTVTMP